MCSLDILAKRVNEVCLAQVARWPAYVELALHPRVNQLFTSLLPVAMGLGHN